MNLHKKHEGETVKALKEFNAHLRNEVHELKTEKSVLNGEILELKDKLKEAEEKAQSNYNDMIDTRLENYDLICKIKKLEVENAALKSQKGSIYTDPVKCRKLKQEGTEHDNT